MKRLDLSTVIRFADDLAKKNAEALSFIPKPKLEHYARVGQLLIECENDEPAGFIVYGNDPFVCRIYQACVQFDARRMEHGLRLVRRVVMAARMRGAQAVSLWCADDLEANKFWEAAGFVFAGQREGGRRRGRKHNRWVLSIDVPLFGRLSGYGAGPATELYTKCKPFPARRWIEAEG